MTGDFTATRVEDPSTVTVTLSGELDILTAPVCARQLGEALSIITRHRTLVIDMRRLEFLGVAGARVLFSAARTCTRIGAPMYIIADPDSAVRIVLENLDTTGVLHVLDSPALVPDHQTRP